MTMFPIRHVSTPKSVTTFDYTGDGRTSGDTHNDEKNKFNKRKESLIAYAPIEDLDDLHNSLNPNIRSSVIHLTQDAIEVLTHPKVRTCCFQGAEPHDKDTDHALNCIRLIQPAHSRPVPTFSDGANNIPTR